MPQDYFLEPLDQAAIEHLIGLLKKGYVFSTGDRGVRRLSYTPHGGFHMALIDRVAGQASTQGFSEEAVRQHLGREPRFQYDTFIVKGLVREAYLAYQQGMLDQAEHELAEALAIGTMTWAPHMGLALVHDAREIPEVARAYVLQALEDFTRPFFHFYRIVKQGSPTEDPSGYADFLTRMIAIVPNCVPAYQQRAEAYRQAGEEAKAALDLASISTIEAKGGI